MSLFYDSDGRSLAKRLRERGFFQYVGVFSVLLFILITLIDAAFEYFFPLEPFQFTNYMITEVPVNVFISVIFAVAGWYLEGKALIKRSKSISLDLDKDDS